MESAQETRDLILVISVNEEGGLGRTFVPSAPFWIHGRVGSRSVIARRCAVGSTIQESALSEESESERGGPLPLDFSQFVDCAAW